MKALSVQNMKILFYSLLLGLVFTFFSSCEEEDEELVCEICGSDNCCEHIGTENCCCYTGEM